MNKKTGEPGKQPQPPGTSAAPFSCTWVAEGTPIMMIDQAVMIDREIATHVSDISAFIREIRDAGVSPEDFRRFASFVSKAPRTLDFKRLLKLIRDGEAEAVLGEEGAWAAANDHQSNNSATVHVPSSVSQTKTR